MSSVSEFDRSRIVAYRDFGFSYREIGRAVLINYTITDEMVDQRFGEEASSIAMDIPYHWIRVFGLFFINHQPLVDYGLPSSTFELEQRTAALKGMA